MVLGIGFLLLVSLLFSAAVAAAGTFFAGYLPTPEVVMHVVTTVVSFLMVTVLFALIYKVVPDVHIEWQDVAIGAAVTSLLFSIGKMGIGLYLGKAGVGSAFGAAGSLVVFMVWVYYSAQIFFLGAEFTHNFAEQHGSRAKARAERAATPQQKEYKSFRHPKLA
jgi:membrane protein